MVDFASLDDVLGLLVDLVADGLRIVAGRGDEEIQRLHTGVAGAFGHDVKELAVGLVVPNLGNRFSHKIDDADTPKEYRNLIIS